MLAGASCYSCFGLDLILLNCRNSGKRRDLFSSPPNSHKFRATHDSEVFVQKGPMQPFGNAIALRTMSVMSLEKHGFARTVL